MNSDFPVFRADDVARYGEARFARIVDQCSDVNAPGKFGRTALFQAARLGRDSHVEILIRHGADPNRPDLHDETSLQTAARHGHLRCVELLLDAGAEINRLPDPAKTEYSETALCSAVWHQEQDAALLLLKRGADPNIASAGHYSPTHCAVARGDLEMCRILLNAGAELNCHDGQNSTPLDDALSEGGFEMVRLLIERGADPNAVGFLNLRPLSNAVRCQNGNSVQFVHELLKAGADPMLKNADAAGTTPIDWAELADDAAAQSLLESLGALPAKEVVTLKRNYTWDEARDAGAVDGATFEDEGDGVVGVETISLSSRCYPTTEGDLALAKHVRATSTRILADYGWPKSIYHWNILQYLHEPATIERIAYYARGRCYNVEGTGTMPPAGMATADALQVMGESYESAVDRFSALGYIRNLCPADSALRNSTRTELETIARRIGLRPAKQKSLIIEQLGTCHEDELAELARRKTWYERTQLGAQFLQRRASELQGPLASGQPVGDTCRTVEQDLIQRMHVAVLAADLENALFLSMELLTANGHPRCLKDSTVTCLRHILKGEWPEEVSCPKADKPKIRVMVAMTQLGEAAGWAFDWDHFGPLAAPQRTPEPDVEFADPILTPSAVLQSMTIQGWDAAVPDNAN